MWWSAFWWFSPQYEINLPKCKLVLFYCKFQSCFANVLEDCPKNPDKVRSNVGCNPKIVPVLSILVRFDNWVQALADETWERRHRSSETLCKAFGGKSSAGRIQWEQFHWPSVRYLQTVINLQKKDVPAKWWALSDKVLTGCFFNVVICNQGINLFWIHKETQFSVRFSLCKNRTCVNGKWSTVVLSYLCIRANSTIRSSLRWIVIGRFWLLQPNQFSVSVLSWTPSSSTSILCVAKLSLYSIIKSSTACFSACVTSVSTQ